MRRMLPAHLRLDGEHAPASAGTGTGTGAHFIGRGAGYHQHIEKRHQALQEHAIVPTMLESGQPVSMESNQPYTEPTPPQYRDRTNTAEGTGPTTAQPMDGAQALDVLIMAQGKPALAAERLGLPDADTLLAAIVLDDGLQDRLRTVMRSFALIRLLGVAESLEDILMERVEQLDNPTIAKLFTNVLQLADLMTRGSNAAGSAANVDPREALLKQLPPEIRGALRVIGSSTMDEAIMNDREGAA